MCYIHLHLQCYFRAVEFTGKSGIYGLRYLSQGFIEVQHYHDFIRFEMLRKEYLNQTFNFMPEIKSAYDNASITSKYERAQVNAKCQIAANYRFF
jgi:hypothetical protein